VCSGCAGVAGAGAESGRGREGKGEGRGREGAGGGPARGLRVAFRLSLGEEHAPGASSAGRVVGGGGGGCWVQSQRGPHREQATVRGVRARARVCVCVRACMCVCVCVVQHTRVVARAESPPRPKGPRARAACAGATLSTGSGRACACLCVCVSVRVACMCVFDIGVAARWGLGWCPQGPGARDAARVARARGSGRACACVRARARVCVCVRTCEWSCPLACLSGITRRVPARRARGDPLHLRPHRARARLTTPTACTKRSPNRCFEPSRVGGRQVLLSRVGGGGALACEEREGEGAGS
jgi:hypothetical protein